MMMSIAYTTWTYLKCDELWKAAGAQSTALSSMAGIFLYLTGNGQQWKPAELGSEKEVPGP